MFMLLIFYGDFSKTANFIKQRKENKANKICFLKLNVIYIYFERTYAYWVLSNNRKGLF